MAAPYLEPEALAKCVRTEPAELRRHAAARWVATCDHRTSAMRLVVLCVERDRCAWRVALAWHFVDCESDLVFFRECSRVLEPFDMTEAVAMHATDRDVTAARKQSLELTTAEHVTDHMIAAFEVVRAFVADASLEVTSPVADDLGALVRETRDGLPFVGNVHGFAPLVALACAVTAPGSFAEHRAGLAKLESKLADERREHFWRKGT